MMLQNISVQVEQPIPSCLSQTAAKLKPKKLQKNTELRQKLATAERTIADGVACIKKILSLIRNTPH